MSKQTNKPSKIIFYVIGGLVAFWIFRRVIYFGLGPYFYVDAYYMLGPYFYVVAGVVSLIVAFFPQKNAYYLLFVLLYGGYQSLFGPKLNLSVVQESSYGTQETSIRAYSKSRIYVPPTPTTYSSSGSSSSSSSSGSYNYSSSSSSSSSSRSHSGGGLSGGK